MTDICDKAQENEEIFLAEALHKARRPYHGQTSHAENAVRAYECEDCGSPIPEARRKAVPGCTRCVLCQAYFEHGFP